MRLNTSLQDTGQSTHRTYLQWNTKCMRFLKHFSNRRIATTKSGGQLKTLIKGAKEVWSKIKIRKIRRVIKSWSFRVDIMVEKLGFQTEHFSQ